MSCFSGWSVSPVVHGESGDLVVFVPCHPVHTGLRNPRKKEKKSDFKINLNTRTSNENRQTKKSLLSFVDLLPGLLHFVD